MGAACSGSSQERSDAPEERRASSAEVAAGLTRIDALAREVVALAGTDKAGATAADAKIEPEWAKVEGTVKANDTDVYLTFEDNFATLKGAAEQANTAKAAAASTNLSKAVADYLVRYPG